MLRCALLLLLAGCVSTAAGEDRPVAERGAQGPVTESVTGATTVAVAETVVVEAPGTAAPAATLPSFAEILAMDGARSTSRGGPSTGSIEGAVPLPLDAPGLVSNPRRPNADGYFGTVETIQALVRAAGVVHRDAPGSALVVNDVGLPAGGRIRHHGSHQSGRDVDVLFFLLDRHGEPLPSKGVPLDPTGRGWDFADLVDPADDVRVRLDARRTWRFVRALLEDEATGPDVHRIFVAEHLRTLLLAEADRARAPARVRARFADVTCQPSAPHDDHLHVRFFCTPEDVRAGCEDTAPMYPWRRAALRAAGVDPVISRPPPRERRARTTSPAEAREAAGAMHRRVREFLDAREVWIRQPHPGRTYCR